MTKRTRAILNFTAAAALLAALCSCGGPEELTPARKDLTEAVYASGSIRPKLLYLASPAVSGRLIKVFVQEGDSVSAGAPLFAIRSESADYNAQAARARLELARDNARAGSPELEAARAQIAVAREKMKQDSLQYARYKRLLAKQAAPRQQFDAAETRYEVSRRQVELAEIQLRSLQNKLNAELRVARSQYKALTSGLEEFLVRSEIDGIVLNVRLEPGELAVPQKPVAEVGGYSDFIAEIFIDEADIAAVETGQAVALKLESADEPLKGAVVKIYPAVNKANKTVRADVSLPPGDYVSGVSAEANIIVSRKKDALVLPRAALLPGDSLMVSREGKTEKIGVKTGASDLEYVEITGGLSPETVVLQPE